MKTMAEKYPDPETWESGSNHQEALRLREEKRQKELSKEEEDGKNKEKEKKEEN